MINKQAKNISMPIPYEAIMHDWWIGLSVMNNGGILMGLDECTVLYRQHNDNVIGASKFGIGLLIYRLSNIKDWIKDQLSVYNQAKCAKIKVSPISFVLYKIYFILIVFF